MAINRYRYYLGPIGLMRALPGFPASQQPEAPVQRPSALHTSLSGRTTQDILGRTRRTWPVAWQWLTEDEELFIQAAIRGQAGGGLRLLDPRKRNLAPEDISTGGGATLTTAAFTDTGAATPTFGTGGVPLDFLGLTSGRIVWNGVTNTQTLYGTSEKTPVVSGSSYRISVYAKTTTTFRLAVRPFDLLGAEQTTVTDAVNNPSNSGTWIRYSWDYTPAGGVVGFYAGLVATGSGNIETCGWQYQIDQALLPWAFGWGCPEVTVSADIPASYWRTKYHNIGFVLREV